MKYPATCDRCSKGIRHGEPLYHYTDFRDGHRVLICKLCNDEWRKVWEEKTSDSARESLHGEGIV